MNKIPTTIKFCLICFVFGTIPQATTAALYSINGATGGNGESILSNGNLRDNGDNRTLPWITRGAVPKAGFFYTGSYSGRSLKLFADDRANDNFGASQKTEYAVVNQNDPYAFPVSKEAGSTNYYTGFAVRLGDNNGNYFDSIADRMMFYQCWQGAGNTNPGFNPPMAFQLLPYKGAISNKDQKLQIWVKDTTHTPNDASSRRTFGTWNMKEKTWYKFVITARPDWSGSGSTNNRYLKVWRNNSKIVDFGGYWGYKPGYYGGPSSTYRYVTSTINIYRAQQKRDHMVCFDNIKHATTKNGATP